MLYTCPSLPLGPKSTSIPSVRLSVLLLMVAIPIAQLASIPLVVFQLQNASQASSLPRIESQTQCVKATRPFNFLLNNTFLPVRLLNLAKKPCLRFLTL